MLTRTGNNTNLMYQVGGAWRSPGFEINDLGYMRSADEINQFAWVGYSRRNPFGIFNRWQLNANEWVDWDFGGTPLRRAVNVNTNGQFRSQHGFYLSATRNLRVDLEHGTARRTVVALAGRAGNSRAASTRTSAASCKLELGGWTYRRDEDSRDIWSTWASLAYQPTNSLRHLAATRRSSATTTRCSTCRPARTAAGDRYLFGRLDQRTAALTFRLDLLPHAGPDHPVLRRAVRLGRHATASSSASPTRAPTATPTASTPSPAPRSSPTDGGYDVDENGDGTVDYAIDNPDFNVRDFNSNLVLRWEYDPGSTLYLVWSQGRTDFIDNGRFRPRRRPRRPLRHAPRGRVPAEVQQVVLAVDEASTELSGFGTDSIW